MGPLRNFLGKLLGNEQPARAPAQQPSPPQGIAAGARPPLPTEEIEQSAEDLEFPQVNPGRLLSPITEVKYMSASESAGSDAAGSTATDHLVLVYNDRELVVDVSDEMKQLGTTDFISRIIEQMYHKYEVLFDTDDIFQVVVLLRKVRPEEGAPDGISST